MGKWAIPNLMKYLCLAMLGVFVLEYLPLPRSAWELLYFNRALILRGQVWRLVTFLFLPPDSSTIWILFSLYFYYFLGTSLENHWGSRRFTLYYGIGAVCCIAAGMITGVTTNAYLNTSLLLAFAVLYPDMTFNLFFFLPVKVKWIGWFWGAELAYEFFAGPMPYKIVLALSLAPFFLFFGKDMYLRLKLLIRHIRFRINSRR